MNIPVNDSEDIEFPISNIPPNLQSHVVEKMTYADFATFNCCSSFSSEICKSLPSHVSLPHRVLKLRITQNLLKDKGNLPENVFYECTFLKIESECWDAIKYVHVKASDVTIEGDKTTTEFVKNILNHTGATELNAFEVNLDVFSLSEVQKLDSLFCYCTEDIPCDVFLNLKVPSLTFDDNSVHPSTLRDYFKEWQKGEREIQSLTLQMSAWMWTNHFTMEMREHFEIAQDECDIFHKFWICRTEDHRDCIGISHDLNEYFSAFAEKYKCPKAQKDKM